MKKNYYIIIPLIISTILAIISCFVLSKKEFDLYVYNQMMINMSKLNLTNLLKNIFSRGEVISMTFFYVMQRIGLQNYIQVIPTFIFYYIILYIIFDYSKIQKYNYKNTILITVLFLSLFKYMDIVANIRNQLALSVFMLAIYLDLIKKTKNNGIYLLYIISPLIHTSLLPIIFLRMILEIKNKKILAIIIVIIFSIMLFPKILILILEPINISLINVISGRLALYITDAEMYLSIQYIFRIMQFITITLFSLYSMLKYKDKNEVKYNVFTIIIYIITIYLVKKYWIFLRFVNFSLFLSLIPLLNLITKKDKKNYELILYLGIGLMIIVGIRIQIPSFVLMFKN